MSTGNYQLLREQLHLGERLLWSGRPHGGIWLPKNAAWQVIFGLMFLAIPSFITVSAYREGSVFGVLIALSFFVGLAIAVVSKLLVEPWQRSALLYGLTDTRAIVIDGLRDRRVRSVNLADLTDIVFNERHDGTGTIRCVGVSSEWHRENKRGEIKPVPLFRLIVDSGHVHRLLLEAKGRSTSAAP